MITKKKCLSPPFIVWCCAVLSCLVLFSSHSSLSSPPLPPATAAAPATLQPHLLAAAAASVPPPPSRRVSRCSYPAEQPPSPSLFGYTSAVAPSAANMHSSHGAVASSSGRGGGGDGGGSGGHPPPGQQGGQSRSRSAHSGHSRSFFGSDPKYEQNNMLAEKPFELFFGTLLCSKLLETATEKDS